MLPSPPAAVGSQTPSVVGPKPIEPAEPNWPGTPPSIRNDGEAAEVEITFLVSPLAQVASILMSSPGPVGMFLICNAAITEPPTLLSGWPDRIESVAAVA